MYNQFFTIKPRISEKNGGRKVVHLISPPLLKNGIAHFGATTANSISPESLDATMMWACQIDPRGYVETDLRCPIPRSNWMGLSMLIEDRDNGLIHPESMPKSWHGMSNSSSFVKRIRMETVLVFVFPPDIPQSFNSH